MAWRDPLIDFTRRLATLLQAGLPLVNALQFLAAEHLPPPWRSLLQQVSERVQQGYPFQRLLPTAGRFPADLPPTDRHR